MSTNHQFKKGDRYLVKRGSRTTKSNLCYIGETFIIDQDQSSSDLIYGYLENSNYEFAFYPDELTLVNSTETHTVTKKNILYRIEYYTLEADFKEESVIHVIAEDIPEAIKKMVERDFQSAGIKTIREIGRDVKGFI